MKIPFSPPDITEEEVEQVAEALRSGWITTGPKTKELERQVGRTVWNKQGCMPEFSDSMCRDDFKTTGCNGG